MNILEAFTGREASRLAVAIEMIVVCIAGVPLLVGVLAHVLLPPPWPMMAGMLIMMVGLRIYIRALRLDTFPLE